MSDSTPPPIDNGPARFFHLVDKGEPFNPAPQRERNRTLLAIGSFSLFSVVVLTFLFAVVAGQTWSRLELAAAVLLPAVSTITSVAIAFFFSLEHTRKGKK